MSFLFLNKTLLTNNLKIRTSMNAKISVFVVCAKAILYLLWYNLHDCTFKFTRGRFHPSLFPTKDCLKNPQPDVLFAVWLPSSTCSLSPLVLELLIYDPCVASAELSPVLEFFWKCILSPFTISKISRSFVRIIHTFKNILTFLLCLQKTRYVPMDEHFSDRLKEF